MKLFTRSPGTWLFWVSLIYFLVGFYAVFVLQYKHLEYIQMVYVLIISLPLWIPPLARWVKVKCIWQS